MRRTLAESSREFRQLSEHVARTGAVLSRDRFGSGQRTVQKALQVVRVERILIPEAEREYREHRMKIFEQRGASRCALQDCCALRPDLGNDLDLGIDEFLLYHGCRAGSVDGILREGFDPCRSGERAGRFFGCGTYFADVAAKADTYVDSTADGMKCLILAQVCLGKALRALQAMPRFQPSTGADGEEDQPAFDSVVGEDSEHGGVLDHREYVIYNGSQAVPRYLVWYQHTDDCKCFRCRSAWQSFRSGMALPPLPLPVPASIEVPAEVVQSASARSATSMPTSGVILASKQVQGSRARSWERPKRAGACQMPPQHLSVSHQSARCRRPAAEKQPTVRTH